MNNFTEFNLPESLMQSLQRIGFDEPTPIQKQAIPFAMQGRDILGSAQTGTGKTGAFGIPLIAKLLENPRGVALVLTPTRELATQVLKALESMISKADKINTALLIGGDPMPKQLQQLRLRPRLIVGTPGRVNDHLERGSLMLHDAGFLVLDETDRMLDMGFSIQIDNILKFLPKKRQTLLFSATLPSNIVSMANRYMTNPERIAAGNQSTPAANIKHEILHVNEAEKYATLLEQLKEREGSIIVFVKTKWNADKMATRLRHDFHEADAIHGDLRQNKRDKVIANFRAKKYRILVATDVAARGLDIPHIEHVINYDLPQCAEDYIHRIGRTARAGAEGSAICFINREDKGKWAAINRLLDPTAPAPKRESSSGGARAGSRNAGGARRSNTNGDWKSDFKKREDGFNNREHSRDGGSRDGASRDGAKREGYKGNRDKREGFAAERGAEGRSEVRAGYKPRTTEAKFEAKPFEVRGNRGAATANAAKTNTDYVKPATGRHGDGSPRKADALALPAKGDGAKRAGGGARITRRGANEGGTAPAVRKQRAGSRD
jgi:ATP-dependent RNA helicase DeaD